MEKGKLGGRGGKPNRRNRDKQIRKISAKNFLPEGGGHKRPRAGKTWSKKGGHMSCQGAGPEGKIKKKKPGEQIFLPPWYRTGGNEGKKPWKRTLREIVTIRGPGPRSADEGTKKKVLGPTRAGQHYIHRNFGKHPRGPHKGRS